MEALLKLSWWRFLVLCGIFLLVFLSFAQLLSDGTISDDTVKQALFALGGGAVGWAGRGRYREPWSGDERRTPEGGRV